MSLVNGINFGCPYEGFYDHPIVFFQSISNHFFMEQRMNQERKAEFLQTLQEVKMDDQVMQFLMNISSKSDISPEGFNKILCFVHDMIYHEQKEFMQKIFKNCVKLLCSIIRDNQLLSIQEWPTKCGGGQHIVQDIVMNILKIFNIPFGNQIYDREIDDISASLAEADIIYLTLNGIKYLDVENIPIGVTLISRLVFSADCSRKFAQQFVQANGMGVINKY